MTSSFARNSAPLSARKPWGATLALLLLAPLARAADAPVDPAQAQFGGQCAEGLAEGKHVVTNCALTWSDKDGKIYCFSSEAQQEVLPEQSDREHAEGARLHRCEQRRSPPKRPCSTSTATTPRRWYGTHPVHRQGQQRHLPAGGSAERRASEAHFDDIDFTRTIDGYGFFPDVKFHDPGAGRQALSDRLLGGPRPGRAQGAGNPHLQGAV